jgi:hypothetical protein
MTRSGNVKRVDGAYAFGRLRKAMAFHEVSRLALENMSRVGDPDAITSNVILAVIAYTDGITAAYGGMVNQTDQGRRASYSATPWGRHCRTPRNAVSPDCSAAKMR